MCIMERKCRFVFVANDLRAGGENSRQEVLFSRLSNESH